MTDGSESNVYWTNVSENNVYLTEVSESNVYWTVVSESNVYWSDAEFLKVADTQNHVCATFSTNCENIWILNAKL